MTAQSDPDENEPSLSAGSDEPHQQGTEASRVQRSGRRSGLSRRLLAGVLAVLVVGSLFSVAPLAVGQIEQPQASIVNVTVVPEDPSVGEPVRLIANVRNSVDAEYGFEITRIEIREKGPIKDTTLTGQEDLGTLGPGDTSTLSLSTRFEEPGIKNLVFVVYGTSTGRGGGLTIRYPVTIVVEDTAPSVDTAYGDLLVGADNPFTVTVSNGKQSAIRDVRVRLSGEEFTVEDPSRSTATIAGGESVPFEFELSSETPGSRLVRVDVSYAIAGIRYSIFETRDVRFRQFGEKVATVSNFAQAPERVRPGDDVLVSFAITNRGGTALRDLSFGVDLNGTPLRAGTTGTDVYVSELPPGGNRTVTYRLRASENADSGFVGVPLTFQYATENGEQVVERTTLSVAVLGEPELRPFVRSVAPSDDGYEVTIDVANVGDGIARAARIAIGNSSYFLGDVEAGEFETATLRVDRGGDRVAVMDYKNGFNEPRASESTVTLPVATSSVPITTWLVGLVVVVSIGAGVWWWRERG